MCDLLSKFRNLQKQAKYVQFSSLQENFDTNAMIISVPLLENSIDTFPPQLEVAVDGNASSLILNNRIPRMFWQAWHQEELILPYTREIKQLQWDPL